MVVELSRRAGCSARLLPVVNALFGWKVVETVISKYRVRSGLCAIRCGGVECGVWSVWCVEGVWVSVSFHGGMVGEYSRMKMGTVTCRVFECGGATR